MMKRYRSASHCTCRRQTPADIIRRGLCLKLLSYWRWWRRWYDFTHWFCRAGTSRARSPRGSGVTFGTGGAGISLWTGRPNGPDVAFRAYRTGITFRTGWTSWANIALGANGPGVPFGAGRTNRTSAACRPDRSGFTDRARWTSWSGVAFGPSGAGITFRSGGASKKLYLRNGTGHVIRLCGAKQAHYLTAADTIQDCDYHEEYRGSKEARKHPASRRHWT